jgi:hypothetical protein
MDYNKVEDYIDLRTKIETNEINVQDGWEIIKKRSGKSWHTSEWKEKRNKYLGSKCENCGSTRLLTLQHEFHPSVPDYVMVMKKLFEIKDPLIASDVEIEDYLKSKSSLRQCCPKCKSVNIQSRMRLSPKWICRGIQNQRSCMNEFETPATTVFYKSSNSNDYEAAKQIAVATILNRKEYSYYQEITSIVENNLKIQKHKLLLYLDSVIKYLSFEHGVKTLCRKCAFMEDKDFNLIK